MKTMPKPMPKPMLKPMLKMTTSQSAHARLLLSMPLSLCVVVGAVASIASADTFTDIKYTDLVARLGANVPTGAGIGMGQVEAPENTQGSYAPDLANPEFVGKTVTLLSGNTQLPSWHGTEVGKAYYGNTQSISKGVTSISVWEVNPWIQSAYLRVGQGVTQPLTPPAGLRVFNHSWIGSFGSAASDNDALRRLDYTVTRDNIFIAAGVNNGAGSVGQAMMAYCFNGVAVGLPDGNHSTSLTPTGVDGAGRRKPDLVAPGQFTSFATPVVGSAAALLFDAADSDPAVATNPNANKALTVKACLMAGTTHRAAWTNNTPTSGASRGIATTPLDTTYGADLLNVDRAHRIFTGGEASDFPTPQTTAFTRHQGWDYVTSIASNTSVYWTFRVHKPVAEASVLATWHRQVATNFTTWNVQDLDLRLWKLEGGALVSITGDAGAASFASGNCESKSAVDNTEHLYLKNLSAGDYVLELRRVAGTQTALPVAVAWYMPDTQMTADLDGNGVVGPGDLAILLNSWGGSGLPDLSGDGVVNAADISIMLSQWGPVL